MRSHTTRSAAISANNGKPEKPQADETERKKNPFQHALLSKNSSGFDEMQKKTFCCFISTRELINFHIKHFHSMTFPS